MLIPSLVNFKEFEINSAQLNKIVGGIYKQTGSWHDDKGNTTFDVASYDNLGNELYHMCDVPDNGWHLYFH